MVPIYEDCKSNMAQININVKTFTGPTPPLTPRTGMVDLMVVKLVVVQVRSSAYIISSTTSTTPYSYKSTGYTYILLYKVYKYLVLVLCLCVTLCFKELVSRIFHVSWILWSSLRGGAVGRSNKSFMSAEVEIQGCWKVLHQRKRFPSSVI